MGISKAIHFNRRLWLGLACALVCALLPLRACFQPALVVGESMQPTFHTGDLVLVNRHTYRGANPERGDIVMARNRRELIVKRVVGLPGETLEVKRGRLYVNGLPIPEKYPVREGALEISKGRLGSGKYALLGDNRDIPEPIHAVVTKAQILGKVVFSIGPGKWRPDARAQ